MTQIPGDPSTWYLLRKSGYIYRFANSPSVSSLSTVANLTDRVVSSAEGGLLGLAFHPDFGTNGYVYIFYTTSGDPLTSRLVRMTSRDGGATLDKSTETILLSIPQYGTFHHSGTLLFGTDGYLYVSVGDGSRSSNGQNVSTLHGKILRLDVDRGSLYGIPADNPFAGGGGLGEIYAWGFRNPWRMSFDRLTGDLWSGDVGDESWEEVNRVRRGGNYGWAILEGTHCTSGTTCNTAGLTPPVLEYSHATDGRCVIGGYVYRGSAMPGLSGTYVFGDWSNGTVWGLTFDAAGNPVRSVLAESGVKMMSFAEGEDGELYLLSGDRIDKLAPSSTASTGGAFPELLSQTGFFDPVDPRKPAACLIPYDINAPLWSDGAGKERFLSLPAGGTIAVLPDGDWEFPVGTTLLKTFLLGGKRIETRLLIRHEDGEWGGYSYAWDEAESDARLLPDAATRVVGTQTWYFPSRAQCLECHTAAANRVLGLETAQMNREILYPTTGRVANQITTYQTIGLFNPPLSDPASSLPALAKYSDESRPIEDRARAYLHSNCSHCHRPNGGGRGTADLRHWLVEYDMGVCDVIPSAGDLGVEGARLLLPGDPLRSIISVRLNTTGPSRMPPIARSLRDPEGTAIVDGWIASKTGCDLPPAPPPGTEVIVDNGGSGTSFTGSWTVSGGPNPYGADSVYSKSVGASYTYRIPLPGAGDYDVSVWYTEYPSRLENVPIDVTHSGGVATVTVDQQTDGGKWVPLGRWTFGTTATIVVRSLGGGSTSADAVKLTAAGGASPPGPSPVETVIDNGQAGTAPSGTWLVSGAPNPYGATSLYSKSAGATYAFEAQLPAAGEYDAYVWYTEYSSRLENVPLEVTHSGGIATVTVNQRTGGGKWTLLGRWTFGDTAKVVVRSLGGGSTSADAVRFASVGTLPPPDVLPGEEILDNGEPGTSWTGTWSVSGGTSPYGASSVYSKYPGDTYTFRFAGLAAADYDVYLWWTSFSSRSSRVPVNVEHAGGTASLEVDQQTGGGRWNLMGRWSFTDAATVTIRSAGGGLSTCADAVRLVPVVP